MLTLAFSPGLFTLTTARFPDGRPSASVRSWSSGTTRPMNRPFFLILRWPRWAGACRGASTGALSSSPSPSPGSACARGANPTSSAMAAAKNSFRGMEIQGDSSRRRWSIKKVREDQHQCPRRPTISDMPRHRSPLGRRDVAGQVQQIYRQTLSDAEDPIVPVELAVDDPPDAGVGDLLEAVPARAGRDVDAGAVDHDAVLGGLDDGVRLGVDGGHAVVVLHHVPGVGAVGHAADRSVVARRQDRPVAHDDGADELARTGRPRGDHLRDVHEVLVPRHSLVHGRSLTRGASPPGRDLSASFGSIRPPVDWKTTLNLPKTDFPMRADLARREPEWLARWEHDRQYQRILDARQAAGAPAFVLHDGPPYATGSIHYGTLLNKVLKDLVVRSQLLMGKRAQFRPGWDCHGLPIEQQVERELGPKARDLDATAFRQKCEEHALKFVDIMRTEFKRIGCLGEWDDPYLTLSKDYEATIARQLAGFVRAGLVYRDKKPVHWCLTHETALAEAEVEYEDHASPSIYVRLPVAGDLGKADPRLRDRKASFVIWTTTPWTMPANLGVVANPELDYVAIPRGDEFLVVAAGLADAFLAATGIQAPAESWIRIPRDGFR